MDDKLTTQAYWEAYYKRNNVSKQQIINVCSQYDTYWDLLFGDKPEGKDLIEIGGFPGRYLAYLASKYNVKPTCLDYNSDAKQIEASFNVLDVNDYDILQKDFTTYETLKTYDYVISNGFIEHFEDFNSILDNHVSYLNNHGKMLIMIPNMKGYIKLYKQLVDPKNLAIHNLKCMSLDVFKDFAARHNLKIKELTYFGGFPHAVHQELNIVQKVIYKLHRLFFKKIANKWVNKYPSKQFSSTILAIFEKK
ncbi:class I SAM-dependent methyltransferase [Psychroserpens luteolus]|uniref:class I SAM-dependent methyltransferase n=1 Tax=Psychroserpens luteolus TaxID=2855840 RepID=UPI001E3E92D6|nr:methyltransferase domain-containing protein [Psychroserpens luteolus]MCD2259807.1 class I SAM-dependent methyltransferase [Psychroserpens luteolus]